MKAWLHFYKEHSKAIFRLKVAVLIIVNITFVYLITMEMIMPVSNFEIKGNWLEKVITTGLGLYTIGGIGVSLNSVKLLFLLSMFIVLNAVVLYFSTIMFGALIFFMMKTCNKIYTNFLINKENVYILGLKFEHTLTKAEKTDILDAVYTSNINVNDSNLYEVLYQMVMELNDKQAIQELVTNQIAMYTIEMEKRELERLRSLQVEKNYDYIQAGLEGIWSYMTPTNLFIVLGRLGIALVSVYVYNSVTGMQNNINTTENIVLNLQKQQAQLLQENENIQLSIFRINNDIEFKTKAVLKSLNETSKNVREYNDLRHDKTVSQIDILASNLSEVSSTVATLREAVAVLSGLVNRLDNKAPADE